ncbi:MAG: transglutaminase family protein [Fibrobacteres bacterium]|nr:transglutaminase family protein [Fibrobacterota bacterium]
MAEDKDLIHILKLLDDDSPKVRHSVWERLEANLPAWENHIRARLPQLADAPRRRLEDLLSGRARRGFRRAWMRWRDLNGDAEKLEGALAGLSWYLAEDRAGRKRGGDGDAPVNHERRAPMRSDAGQLPRHPALAPLLDGLTAAYRAVAAVPSASGLAAFLFAGQGFKGAEGDYYDPEHSDLVLVIERRRGIPISLACVFILVGHRLGLSIHGCDVPEHFLTRASEGGRDIIIDCFDGGKILDPESLAQLELKYAPAFARLLRTPAEPDAIVARVLRNLINAYHLAGDRQASQFMFSLAEDLRGGRPAAGAVADIVSEAQDEAGPERPFGEGTDKEEDEGSDGSNPDLE